MPDNLSPFERRRNLLSQRIEQRRDAAYKAFNVGGRPYGKKQVSGKQLNEWWQALPVEEKLTKWGELDEATQGELKQGMGDDY